MSHIARLGVAFFLLVSISGCLEDWANPPSEDWSPPASPAQRSDLSDARGPCRDSEPLRRAFFGDLHTHTAWSLDAWTRGTRTTPDDAFRFARGGEIPAGPLGADGRHTARLRMERPLDFAAVTDHAEYLSEVSRCTDATSDVHDSLRCRIFRGEQKLAIPGMSELATRAIGISGWGRPAGLCGDDGMICRNELLSLWVELQRSAERWYDRSDSCRFTTFVGYEWSFSPGRSKVHRNVIFRNASVPELPYSWIDTPEEELLWQRIRDNCIDTDSGCDAIAIPHNPNLSNGQMFAIPWRDAPPAEQRRLAELRASVERLVEMMQIKGESECREGMWGVVGAEDELCGFEKLRKFQSDFPDCEDGTGTGALRGKGCVSRLDFVRYALLEGLREEGRTGSNPYRFGFIGSTDGHRSAPGDVSEDSFAAAGGAGVHTSQVRLALEPDFAEGAVVGRNPGGLMGVWAEENSRDSLFDAMKRRETFATSGPRIRPRFFGGWRYPADLCGQVDWVGAADRDGVAMGSVLAASASGDGGPVFVAAALRDAGTARSPGGRLERIQIVKGWVGEGDLFHQAIYDVAGTPVDDTALDLDTCREPAGGADQLCTVWRDPDFDPSTPAVYYARVLEAPSCRWHWRECLGLPESARPDGCESERLPKIIRERAWTSPIWYDPDWYDPEPS